MISVKRILFGKSIPPLLLGFLIFIVSQILGVGYELSQAVYAHKQVGLNLPVPWHLQTLAFLLVVVLAAACFFTIIKSKHQRTGLIFTLIACFFVLHPLGWLFAISHGQLDIMTNKLQDFPNTLIPANTWVEEEKVIQILTEYGHIDTAFIGIGRIQNTYMRFGKNKTSYSRKGFTALREYA